MYTNIAYTFSKVNSCKSVKIRALILYYLWLIIYAFHKNYKHTHMEIFAVNYVANDLKKHALFCFCIFSRWIPNQKIWVTNLVISFVFQCAWVSVDENVFKLGSKLFISAMFQVKSVTKISTDHIFPVFLILLRQECVWGHFLMQNKKPIDFVTFNFSKRFTAWWAGT